MFRGKRKAVYYFSNSKRGRLVPTKDKNRVVINPDHAVPNAHYICADRQGTAGYGALPCEVNEPEMGLT